MNRKFYGIFLTKFNFDVFTNGKDINIHEHQSYLDFSGYLNISMES